MRGKGLRAHELAQQLLAGPDDEVMLIVDNANATWLDRVQHDPGGRTVDLLAQSRRRAVPAVDDPDFGPACTNVDCICRDSFSWRVCPGFDAGVANFCTHCGWTQDRHPTHLPLAHVSKRR